MEKQKTIVEFINYLKEDYPQFSEIEIRKGIDSLAFWVRDSNSDELFIMHLYLNWLSDKFNFEIDTDVDSRN